MKNCFKDWSQSTTRYSEQVTFKQRGKFAIMITIYTNPFIDMKLCVISFLVYLINMAIYILKMFTNLVLM